MVHYTTVRKDKYGRYYDLRYEHPSWEQHKRGGERSSEQAGQTAEKEAEQVIN